MTDKSPYLITINNQTSPCHLVDFSIQANHLVKIKERRMTDKYL